MQNPKFQIYTGKNKKFYFRLRAKNGQIILTGQGYAAKAGCQNGIQSVQENAANDERYQRKTAANGQFYFNLIAANGQVIGSSETYKTKSGCDNGIEAVKNTAPTAPTEDTT